MAPEGRRDATVHKPRKKGRVVHVDVRIVFGQEEASSVALAASPGSPMIHPACVERHHGTDRHRHGRKLRKTLGCSQDWQRHNAVTSFTMYSSNFCWPVRTRRMRGAADQWEQRTPAMAAGLADHGWSLTAWLTFPAVQLK